MSLRIGADVLLREHETRMHDPRGMSARSDKNVRWSRHGPPAVHQFCPWGTRGSPSLILITSACPLNFTWKLRLCSLRHCLSFSFSLCLSRPPGLVTRRRLTTMAMRRIMKFCVTKDSRETSWESGWKLNSIHRLRRTGFASVRSTYTRNNS